MNEIRDLVMQYLPKIAIVIAVTMIAFVILEPFLIKDRLQDRKKAILTEREIARNRERITLASAKRENSITDILVHFANRAKLALWLLDAETLNMLVRAGYRAPDSRNRFLALRVLMIIGCAAGFIVYCIVNNELSWLPGMPFFAWIGYRLSVFSLERKAKARDAEMLTAAPDIVDLLTICVESGMSVELGLQRVAEEIGLRSSVAADELGVTAAELSYLSKRSDAFANLAQRTGAKTIQNLCVALIQADSFGTSIVATLRIQSAEARRMRQLEAERMALSIPPKLSVVMVFFFVPIILIVMLYPAINNMSGLSFGF